MNFQTFCQQFGHVDDVVAIGKRYFYDPQHLHREEWDVFSVGIYLGEEKKTFQPSSALIGMLATEQRVTVTEQATWLFLCGRDVLMDGVLQGTYPKDTYVFVVDKHNNVLGYGRVVYTHDPKKKSQIYIKNLLDKGEYLRREK